AVFDVTTEIMTARRLSDATYARAKALLGEGVLIELIWAIGFYSMVGITLTSFDVPTPDGSKQLD
ncbi:MAG TPA: carboxymuconolactone decarboxylase family protein, partial [Stellaceae bacterium]|nr:carboxymuconolactone decarboxylase family protein [Stellaceae bacterium]